MKLVTFSITSVVSEELSVYLSNNGNSYSTAVMTYHSQEYSLIVKNAKIATKIRPPLLCIVT